MRLACVESGHGEPERQVLAAIETQSGRPPSDVIKTLYYRPDLFGKPFSEVLDVAMRGESTGARVSGSSSRRSFRRSTSVRSERRLTARSRRSPSVRRRSQR